MRRMIRFEVEIFASVGGFSVNIVASAIPFLLTRISRKGTTLIPSLY
jgi:hypothetical protein